jgi:hypothetical protein
VKRQIKGTRSKESEPRRSQRSLRKTGCILLAADKDQGSRDQSYDIKDRITPLPGLMGYRIRKAVHWRLLKKHKPIGSRFVRFAI